MVAARKKGILLSNGEYIGFVDSDDWIDSDMIHNIIDQSYGEDVIAFGMNEEYGYKNVLKNNSLRSGYYSKEILQSKIMSMMLCDGRFYSFGILPNLVCKLIKKIYFVLEEAGIRCMENMQQILKNDDAHFGNSTYIVEKYKIAELKEYFRIVEELDNKEIKYYVYS